MAEAKKLSKAEQLKKIKADKKKLNDEQKALRKEMDAGKSERIEKKKAVAKARKESRIHKTTLRKMCTDVQSVFSEGDSKAIEKLADGIMETASELAASVRAFGEASDSLDDL